MYILYFFACTESSLRQSDALLTGFFLFVKASFGPLRSALYYPTLDESTSFRRTSITRYLPTYIFTTPSGVKITKTISLQETIH